MNEVFIVGKIITDVEFNFMINSKNISIINFKIVTIKDKQKINIVAYDEIADKIYIYFKLNDIVMINGYLKNNKVIVNEIIEFR